MKLPGHIIYIRDGVVDFSESHCPKGVVLEESRPQHINMRVSKVTQLATPIHFVLSGQASDEINIHLTIEQQSSALVLQEFMNTTLQNAINLNIELEKVARLECVTLLKGENNRQKTSVIQGQDSEFQHYQLSTQGINLYHGIQIHLKERRAACHLHGIYLLSENQSADHHLTIHHQHENTQSRQIYKGILDDEAEAKFRGRVIVDKNAQKIVAHQQNNNLLLSKAAVIDTRPELEIFADDVKCSHGATVGQLDQDAFYFLRCRGIPYEMARKLLTRGFIQEVINQFPFAIQSLFQHQHPLLEDDNVQCH